MSSLRAGRIFCPLLLPSRELPEVHRATRHSRPLSCLVQNSVYLRRNSFVLARLFSTTFHNSNQQEKSSVMSGVHLIQNPKLFKGLVYSQEERDSLGIRGLLPPAIRKSEQQAKLVLENFYKRSDDLGRYLFLREVQDLNERLFYRLLCEHTEELMPYVYTPVVGQACIEFSNIYCRPRGLFITINDLGNVDKILQNWPEENVKALVVTDGERILGLGDLGANGMGISIGKLSLYTALAAIEPASLLPVTLDVGTNNEKLLNDPMYIGLRHKRVTGEKYDQLIDEFMKAVKKRYGSSCLIQFEDFANQNAFRLLEKYNDSYCTFNDDIQGTASVAVAGILASVKMTQKKVSEHTFLFFGAGEAALGIANLLVMEMLEEGLTKEQAVSRIWLLDSRGLVVKSRKLDVHKEMFAKDCELLRDLEAITDLVKPSVLIGVAAQPSVFTKSILQKLARQNHQPIVFALSNPTDKAECTAEEAYNYTDGRCIFASGSPFNPVNYKGKTFHPGQGNNAYIFPGVSLALIACEARTVGNKVFLVAAKALSEQVTKAHMDEGRVYPPLDTIRRVSMVIAVAVSEFLYKNDLATHKPKPADLEKFLTEKQYKHIY